MRSNSESGTDSSDDSVDEFEDKYFNALSELDQTKILDAYQFFSLDREIIKEDFFNSQALEDWECPKDISETPEFYNQIFAVFQAGSAQTLHSVEEKFLARKTEILAGENLNGLTIENALNAASTAYQVLSEDIFHICEEVQQTIKETLDAEFAKDSEEELSTQEPQEISPARYLKLREEEAKNACAFFTLDFMALISTVSNKVESAEYDDTEIIDKDARFTNGCTLFRQGYETALELIKKNSRTKLLKYHPDKNPNAEAQEIFKEIKPYYEFLCEYLDNYLKFLIAKLKKSIFSQSAPSFEETSEEEKEIKPREEVDFSKSSSSSSSTSGTSTSTSKSSETEEETPASLSKSKTSYDTTSSEEDSSSEALDQYHNPKFDMKNAKRELSSFNNQFFNKKNKYIPSCMQSVFGINNTEEWQIKAGIIKAKALNALVVHLGKASIKEQLELIAHAKKLPFINTHRHNFFFTGAFGNTETYKCLEQLEARKNAEQEMEQERSEKYAFTG